MINNLIENIPKGTLIRIIGEDVYESLELYCDMIDIDNDIKLSDIVINRFGKDLLINLKNEVLKNIILFIDDNNLKNLKSEFKEIEKNNDDFKFELNRLIKKHFKYSNYEFCSRLLGSLDLKIDDYIFEPLPTKIVEQTRDVLFNYVGDQKAYFPLHDFQKNIKNDSLRILLSNENSSRVMIHLPTGSGKTKTAMEILCDFMRSRVMLGGFNVSSKILWFAHSEELCEQAFTSFVDHWTLRGDSNCNVIKYFGKNQLPNQFVDNENVLIIAGFQKMISGLRGNNVDVRNSLGRFRENVDLVVVDEAHRTMATEWCRAIEYFSDNPNTQMLGLTATPGRTDQKETEYLSYFYNSTKICLSDEFGVPIEKPIKFLQEKEVLAKIEYKQLDTNENLVLNSSEFERIKKYGTTDKLRELLRNLSKSPLRNKAIINELLFQYDQNKIILVFACNKIHCMVLQSLLSLHGVKSDVILSDTSREQREVSIKNFKDKDSDLKILINFGVLTTGFDAPSLNCVLIARPVFSIVLFSQMVGRALRGKMNQGNAINTLITLRDNIALGELEDLFESFDIIWNEEN
jgi:DNA repair protein RadD